MAISQINPASISGLGYGFKNRIINGAMVIDQRNNGSSSTFSGVQYGIDRWFSYSTSGSGHTLQQVADAPAGFVNSLKITIGTGASPSAAQQNIVGQGIEGYNVADFNFGSLSAKTLTYSFWVKSSVTGTMNVWFLNNGSTRSYVSTYTINSANTWEYKTVTFTGDTSGTWLTTNGAGIVLGFSLGSGSNYNATANTWSAGDYKSTTGATSVVATSGATWQITGVQLESGVIATTFDYRPYSTELLLCQRYYQKFISTVSYGNLAYGKAYNGTTLNCFRTFYTPMRTTPSTFDSSAANTFFGENGSTSFVGSAIAINPFTTNPYQGGFDISITGATTGAFMSLVANNNASSYIAFGAEL